MLVGVLVSRKRCDFESAETLRFKIAPRKKRFDFSFLKIWAPSTYLCCFKVKKTIAIWILRFGNAAICDFIPRCFCDFYAKFAVRVAICNLQFGFENAALYDANVFRTLSSASFAGFLCSFPFLKVGC